MTAPWTAADIDPDRVAADLARLFPDVTAWWGEFTGRWWALTRDRTGRYRLVEAANPVALAELLGEIRAPRYSSPYVPTGARAANGPGCSASSHRAVRAVAPSRPPTRRSGTVRRRREGRLRGMIATLLTAWAGPAAQ